MSFACSPPRETAPFGRGSVSVSEPRPEGVVWRLGLLLMLAAAAPLAAQRARLVGTLSDPSGAAVAGAVVRAAQLDTGLRWQTATDARGEYSLDLLPPGRYAVEAEAASFAPAKADNVRLAVHATQRVNLRLALAQVPERIEVAAAAPLVETETSEQGAVVRGKLIDSLPLNGRDFLQLARLAPGVLASVDNVSGPSGGFNANGQRDLSNNILIDGVNVNAGGSARGRISLSVGHDAPAGQGGSALSLISVDAVAEFKVQTQLAPAEFGAFAGAVINVNSRSGGNELRGRLYHFLRNSALDANNFFFNANGVEKTPARNNFVGATVGGPIRKDRTFFFGSFEGLRQRLGVSSNARVPSRAARAQAGAVARPLLDLYPLPTGPDNPDGSAPYFAAGANLVGETNLSARLDHRLGAKDDLFARYSFSDSLGVFRSFYLNFLSDNLSRLQNFTLSHVRRFSPSASHEAKFGFVRSANFQLGALDGFGGARPVALDADHNATAPGILVFSLPFAVAHNPLFVQNNNLFTFADNFSLFRGRHSLRAGFWARRLQGNTNLKPLLGGVYLFDTVRDVIDNSPTIFFSQAGLSGLGVRFSNFGAYFHEDLRVSRRLRLNAGLRYELNTVPSEAAGRLRPISGLADLRSATLGAPDAPLHNGDRNNFAPRAGFAWQLTGDARTVLRGGFGVYYDSPTLNTFQLVVGPPFKITNIVLGSKLGGPARVPIDPGLVQTTVTGRPPFGAATVYDPERFGTPYTYHYNLNLQRELDSRTVVQASFAGAHGRDLIRFRALNLLDPRTSEAPNPNFPPGSLSLIETAARSNYSALQISATRRVDRGLEILTSYTLGHSLDETSNGTGTSLNSTFTASNPSNPRAEYGSSDFDVRQNLVAAFSYDLPFSASSRARRLVEGWSVQGIFSARTALPYTPLLGRDVAGNGDQSAANNQRPDIVAGQPLYSRSTAPPFHVAHSRAFAEPAAGTYGNAGRNILRGSGLQQLDLGILKTTKISERLSAQFRAEFFNLFNHANFALPAASGNHLLTAGADFGLSKQMANESSGGLLPPLFSAGGPRSIQLALKILF